MRKETFSGLLWCKNEKKQRAALWVHSNEMLKFDFDILFLVLSYLSLYLAHPLVCTSQKCVDSGVNLAVNVELPNIFRNDFYIKDFDANVDDINAVGGPACYLTFPSVPPASRFGLLHGGKTITTELNCIFANSLLASNGSAVAVPISTLRFSWTLPEEDGDVSENAWLQVSALDVACIRLKDLRVRCLPIVGSPLVEQNTIETVFDEAAVAMSTQKRALCVSLGSRVECVHQLEVQLIDNEYVVLHSEPVVILTSPSAAEDGEFQSVSLDSEGLIVCSYHLDPEGEFAFDPRNSSVVCSSTLSQTQYILHSTQNNRMSFVTSSSGVVCVTDAFWTGGDTVHVRCFDIPWRVAGRGDSNDFSMDLPQKYTDDNGQLQWGQVYYTEVSADGSIACVWEVKNGVNSFVCTRRGMAGEAVRVPNVFSSVEETKKSLEAPFTLSPNGRLLCWFDVETVANSASILCTSTLQTDEGVARRVFHVAERGTETGETRSSRDFFLLRFTPDGARLCLWWAKPDSYVCVQTVAPYVEHALPFAQDELLPMRSSLLRAHRKDRVVPPLGRSQTVESCAAIQSCYDCLDSWQADSSASACVWCSASATCADAHTDMYTIDGFNDCAVASDGSIFHDSSSCPQPPLSETASTSLGPIATADVTDDAQLTSTSRVDTSATSESTGTPPTQCTKGTERCACLDGDACANTSARLSCVDGLCVAMVAVANPIDTLLPVLIAVGSCLCLLLLTGVVCVLYRCGRRGGEAWPDDVVEEVVMARAARKGSTQLSRQRGESKQRSDSMRPARLRGDSRRNRPRGISSEASLAMPLVGAAAYSPSPVVHSRRTSATASARNSQRSSMAMRSIRSSRTSTSSTMAFSGGVRRNSSVNSLRRPDLNASRRLLQSIAMSRTVVSSPKAPAAVGAYSQAIKANGQVWVSGCIALDTKGEFVGTTVGEQAEQVMKNMGYILEAANSSFAQVVKTTILLRDINDFATVNDVYKKYFEGMEPPARACYAVSGLPKNALVEIEAIALYEDDVKAVKK